MQYIKQHGYANRIAVKFQPSQRRQNRTLVHASKDTLSTKYHRYSTNCQTEPNPSQQYDFKDIQRSCFSKLICRWVRWAGPQMHASVLVQGPAQLHALSQCAKITREYHHNMLGKYTTGLNQTFSYLVLSYFQPPNMDRERKKFLSNCKSISSSHLFIPVFF